MREAKEKGNGEERKARQPWGDEAKRWEYWSGKTVANKKAKTERLKDIAERLANGIAESDQKTSK
jgi:hypothetical protein